MCEGDGGCCGGFFDNFLVSEHEYKNNIICLVLLCFASGGGVLCILILSFLLWILVRMILLSKIGVSCDCMLIIWMRGFIFLGHVVLVNAFLPCSLVVLCFSFDYKKDILFLIFIASLLLLDSIFYPIDCSAFMVFLSQLFQFYLLLYYLYLLSFSAPLSRWDTFAFQHYFLFWAWSSNTKTEVDLVFYCYSQY